MDWTLWIIAGIILLIIALFIKSFKKHFAIKAIKLFLIILVLFAALVLLSTYFDIGGFFSQKSQVVRTGAAIVDAVKGSLG